jgi:predicted metal-dependent phosphoesterase TrpH
VSGAIDLHLHTRASDGQWTPAGLVARARASGIGTISVTDHDVISAVDDVCTLGAAAGVAVIPGVEATVHWRGAPLHLLLYGEAVLTVPVTDLLQIGRVSIDRWVRTLASHLPDRPARHRLVEAEHLLAATVLVRAARECGGTHDLHDVMAHVASTRPDVSPGLDLATVARSAQAAGAIPILAHPMREGLLTRALDHNALNDLLDDVPAVRGIEVVHPRHSPDVRVRLATLAASRAILQTAGSDSHGPARAHPPVAWPEDLARDFLARIRSDRR